MSKPREPDEEVIRQAFEALEGPDPDSEVSLVDSVARILRQLERGRVQPPHLDRLLGDGFLAGLNIMMRATWPPRSREEGE